jgi:hypothetical protein
MFFLGGLNSALPCLLYLSLIWVFMIIGMTGRHHFAAKTSQDTGNISATFSKSLESEDNYLIHNYFDQPGDISISQDPAIHFHDKIEISPQSFLYRFCEFLNFKQFRGPPLMA